MIRSLCRSDRTRLDTGWLLGSSVVFLVAVYALVRIGADLYALALMYGAFPMAVLVADPERRRQRPVRLVLGIALLYLAMLAISVLAEAF